MQSQQYYSAERKIQDTPTAMVVMSICSCLPRICLLRLYESVKQIIRSCAASSCLRWSTASDGHHQEIVDVSPTLSLLSTYTTYVSFVFSLITIFGFRWYKKQYRARYSSDIYQVSSWCTRCVPCRVDSVVLHYGSRRIPYLYRFVYPWIYGVCKLS